MKYEVMKSDFVREENGVSLFRVDIVADTASDIPEALDFWVEGSMALCADTKEIKVLNSERQWV